MHKLHKRPVSLGGSDSSGTCSFAFMEIANSLTPHIWKRKIALEYYCTIVS